MKRKLFILFCIINLSACSNLAYYSQAIGGQWHIWKSSQSIDNVLANPATSPQLKQQLLDILQARNYASEVLLLPDNRSYTYYADLKRPFVVWSVFATPAFSLEAKQWCFPIVGCVSYRGHFSEAAATTLAEELRAQDYDVYVAGIAAYSTLGWFSDPVLNTMLKWSRPQITGLIFHELAHQKFYIPDDTAFNEAFAMTVEYVGVERWLAQYGTPKEIKDYKRQKNMRAEFTTLVLTIRNQLQQLYEQDLTRQAMQTQKNVLFSQLRNQYAELKKHWGGYSGYDAWFAQDLNNAKLLSIATYEDYVPALRRLLLQVGDDLPKFYAKVVQLSELSMEERHSFFSIH